MGHKHQWPEPLLVLMPGWKWNHNSQRISVYLLAIIYTKIISFCHKKTYSAYSQIYMFAVAKLVLIDSKCQGHEEFSWHIKDMLILGITLVRV